RPADLSAGWRPDSTQPALVCDGPRQEPDDGDGGRVLWTVGICRAGALVLDARRWIQRRLDAANCVLRRQQLLELVPGGEAHGRAGEDSAASGPQVPELQGVAADGALLGLRE